MIRAVPENFNLAAFLLRTLPEDHHAELRALLPEAAALEWVAARRRALRKDLAQAMAAEWKISRATAYRCLTCIDTAMRQDGEAAAA